MTTQLAVEQASDLIGLVYDSALEKGQWKSLMARIRDLCPGHVAAVTTFEDANWRSSHEATLPEGEQGAQISEVIEAVEADPSEQPTDINTLIFRRQPLELGTLYQTRALLSEEEFRGSEVYKKTMAPLGAGHWSAVHFSISGNRRAAIMVVENERDDTPKDTALVGELLRLVGPHAVRAARIARALDMARQAAQTYSGFIDAVALPLLVLSWDARLQMANTMGQRLLDAGQLFTVTGSGQVALADPVAQEHLARAIEDCLTNTSPRAQQVDLGGAKLALCVCPFLPTISFGSRVDEKVFENQRFVTVFIGARADGVINTELLRDAFLLSQREAEICVLLMAGITPAQIAEQTGRSERTVRNQIHAVHTKIGVKSSSELREALGVFRTVGAMLGE